MPSDKRQKLLMYVAAAVIALLFADSVVLTPLANSWQERSKEIAELRKEVTGGEQLQESSGRLRSRMDGMRDNSLSLNRSDAEFKMLSRLYELSTEERFTLTSIVPSWRGDLEDGQAMLECRLEGTGSMEAVSRFIHGIDAEKMALRINSVEMTSRDPRGGSLGVSMIVSGLQLAEED